MVHTDQKYIAALITNDQALLEEIYSKYAGKITWMVLQNNGNEDYQEAEDIFEDVLLRQPSNSEAVKNLGLTHLAKGEYEQALEYFERLATRKDLYANQGKFFQAMVLLKRGNSEDLNLAEKLLKEVVNLQLEGNLVAKRWLESL